MPLDAMRQVTQARRDALHIALAAVYGIDFLLTWNCKYIANAQILVHLAFASRSAGYQLPYVCTPYELMGTG